MDSEEYDARFRCRYCGAPCGDGGICFTHADLLYGEPTAEGMRQLTVYDELTGQAVRKPVEGGDE